MVELQVRVIASVGGRSVSIRVEDSIPNGVTLAKLLKGHMALDLRDVGKVSAALLHKRVDQGPANLAITM